MTLTPAQAMDMLLSDRALLMESLVTIENKDRELVPMELRAIQRSMLLDSIGRDVYVKPAQIGASSVIICDFLLDVLTVPGTVAVIISYDEFITGRLLRKAHTFHRNLTDRIPTIPKMHHKSTFEMTFPAVNSSFYIGSARSFTFGRGETIHDLMLDEYAFWQPGDAERIFASALQRVPLTTNTKVKIVSTPNGEDNDFCETYRAAKEGLEVGKSVFKAHFYPWYLHEEYIMLPDSAFALPGDDTSVLKNLDPDELVLMTRFETLGYSEEEAHNRIRWRRYKIAEMSSLRRSGETRLLFGQEYPEDDESCFLTAGDMVYDVAIVNEMAKSCYPAPIHEFYADVWEPPEEGKKYLLAIDPGKGKVSESVGTVWSFTDTDYNHHATLSGFYDEDKMAVLCMNLAKWYNGAVIAPEANLDIVSHLKTYPELYYRTDPITGKIGNQIGWVTSPRTKPYMISEMIKHLTKIRTHDSRIVSQLHNIRWVGDRAVAIGSDDYHDSAAIAIVCKSALPIERGLVGTCGWSNSWGKRR
jgi:hypothetical protein